MEAINTLIDALRTASHDARSGIKNELIALAKGAQSSAVREHLENMKKGELLEIQWEIDDVLDESAPTPSEPPPVEPEPEPEEPADEAPEAPDQQERLTAADLDMVYDDPRGFMLHKSKVGDRWFATQVDPSTGMPQTFELHAQEIEQLKAQLQGSPYWRLGS